MKLWRMFYHWNSKSLSNFGPNTSDGKRHGGIVERSQLWGRRVPRSKPDSTEDLPYMWACCTLNHTQGLKHPPAAVVWKFGEEGARSGVVLVILSKATLNHRYL
ncbi:hypothetical protein AVEN_224960-1 [Araneus ventricosus]|uniref:Uncharacterized protein n=1 Tax=Araneus ventricosus TaxID=182803 RepID=A0A4Y2U207_ARAVE|nr:hypothetical protein AVEN_224960-1 [Araneus ventricosus]